MKIISWNVRGVGSSMKTAIIKNSIRNAKADLVLIKESKMSSINDKIIRKIWSNRHVKWAAMDM